jgi:hypothetical protein
LPHNLCGEPPPTFVSNFKNWSLLIGFVSGAIQPIQ